jgi:hypothetical protein
MANTGIRQLTTVVGGYAKRIWYSLNGTTPTNELMSIDDTGKLKCVSEQVTGLAGTGNRMVVADSTGNLSADSLGYSEYMYIPTLSSTGETGSWGYFAQYGKCVRIGNKLTIFLVIGWDSKPSAGTNIKISLPVQADVYALRGFLSEYIGITFAGNQLVLSNNNTDNNNIYIFQNLSGGGLAGINVSDVASSGVIKCVVETLVI